MSFSALKKDRKKSLTSLVEESKKLSENNYDKNKENYWTLTVDKMQNGSAVIRFLPAPDGEDTPWVRLFSHGFKDVGGWLIDNCPTTVGKECPVCVRNSELWAQGENSPGRKIVTGMGNEMPGSKRKLAYISNIYVVKDPGNPANEGKVFLFRYGKKIFEQLMDQMNPEFDDEVAVNPFDLWEGATFRLKARKVDGYRNYEKSSFDAPSALLDDDKALEEVYNQEFGLAEFIAGDQFKSYDDLQNRLSKIMGNVDRVGSDAGPSQEPDEGKEDAPMKRPQARQETAETADLNEEDENTSFFTNLAKDD